MTRCTGHWRRTFCGSLARKQSATTSIIDAVEGWILVLCFGVLGQLVIPVIKQCHIKVQNVVFISITNLTGIIFTSSFIISITVSLRFWWLIFVAGRQVCAFQSQRASVYVTFKLWSTHTYSHDTIMMILDPAARLVPFSRASTLNSKVQMRRLTSLVRSDKKCALCHSQISNDMADDALSVVCCRPKIKLTRTYRHWVADSRSTVYS